MNDRKESSTPWADEAGIDEFTHLIVKISRRICECILAMEESTKYDGRFMANIHALRLLKEAYAGGGYLLSKYEVEFWEKSYIHWLNKIKRFPKGLSREQLIAAAEPEFVKLRKMSINFPQSSWLSGLIKVFRNLGKDEIGLEIYNLVILRQDWTPCKLIVRKNEDDCLVFDQFELAKTGFAERGLKNDGNCWMELLEAYSDELILSNIDLTSTATMVKASSAKIGFLDQVRSNILQFIHYPAALDRALQRRDAAGSSAANSTITLPIPEIRQDDWSPCRLVPYTNEQGQQEYSVIFDQFELAEEAFAERGLENDGYGWTDLLRAFADKRTLKTLDFDPESSMVSVLSSKVESLKKVRGWITQLLEDPKSLDKVIKRMK